MAFAQKPVFTTAKIKAATVYFNAAELTQNTSVNLPAGTSEIVIKNIANNLNQNTIQIGAPASVTVLSVQFTNNYISEFEIDESNPAIKKVNDSINWVKREIKRIQILNNSNKQTIALLDNNQSVSGTNTGLNVAELMKLVEYSKAKRTELENTIVDLMEKEEFWNKKLTALNNKLAFNTKNEEKYSTGKLILQVMNDVAGNIPLDITYITNSAIWKPFYDLRAESIKNPINMMYKAQVFQNSGIDWKKVKLTLSSGNPNQNNQAPQLQPWFLTYSQPEYISNALQGKVSGIQVAPAGSGPKDGLREVIVTADKKLNKSDISRYTSINENQLNVSFDIDIPYDILSNWKAHSVALKEIKLPATYTYYAAPKGDKEAFLLAEINDYSKYNLLPGEANIIFEGMYVGKTTINPNQTADTLKLSMGRDKKIAITREKIADKSGTKFLSSYKEQTFTYDITVKNNKKEEVEITLEDQYPLSTDKEITIELTENGKAKVNQETGKLSWNLKLSPNESKKIRISYKVKYPKDKNISNL
ncbi:membrane protein [Flavobacterium flevense]|uniref:Membrane protein n=2 Tax=Flavobacterium flevense TaxID=983 RepID=A0A4Y4AXS2_9FLAO|nr:membrane protein [Flavobacterium flevense]